MSSYRPISVADAGAIMAPKLGLRWSDDRREVVDFLNRYRNLLYNRYERQRLFDSVFACFCPSLFHNECSSCSPCDRCYRGFTLPRDMAGAVQAWQWGYPLRMRNAWRESFTGRAPTGGDFLDVVEVRENFPTERDLQRPAYLQVFAENQSDGGKVVMLEVVDENRRPAKIKFTLEGSGTVTSDLLVRSVKSVVLPSDRTGFIVLSDTNGWDLSQYSPGENSVPAYKRYKLPNRCSGNVLVQGTRQMTDVYFDEDVVEIGDRMVLEFMGTYFKHYESLDPRENAKGLQALQNAYDNLDGLVSRDDGGKLPQPVIHAKPKCQLPGYNKYYPVVRP